MGLLSQIKAVCEKQQYCHNCAIRSFCTELRAKPPRYWPDKQVKTYDFLFGKELAEEPAPAKKTRKKKGE